MHQLIEAIASRFTWNPSVDSNSEPLPLSETLRVEASLPSSTSSDPMRNPNRSRKPIRKCIPDK
jgi:hypothetical protein